MTLNMGIIKLEVSLPEATQALEEFRRNRIQALDTIGAEIKLAVSTVFNQLLKSEMTLFLGKPDQAGNKKNGYQEREYALKGVGCIRIRMPVDRKRKFESAVVPPREQIDPRLKEDMAVLHLAGLSTRTAFQELKAVMGTDAERAVHCIEKDLDSLLVHYRFDKSLWRALKTTNPIERVNREFKRRTKAMDTLGERTLQI
jgi:transposase-like protein